MPNKILIVDYKTPVGRQEQAVADLVIKQTRVNSIAYSILKDNIKDNVGDTILIQDLYYEYLLGRS